MEMIKICCLVVLCLYTIYPLLLGYMGFLYMDFILTVKDFKSVYYTFGMWFIEHETEDPEYVEQEFTIALFLFSISFIFYKNKENA